MTQLGGLSEGLPKKAGVKTIIAIASGNDMNLETND